MVVHVPSKLQGAIHRDSRIVLSFEMKQVQSSVGMSSLVKGTILAVQSINFEWLNVIGPAK